ncbi:MAG: aromatic ring-hydroxylating dioxygenase subunit alpha [Pseudomonadota bacterium]
MLEKVESVNFAGNGFTEDATQTHAPHGRYYTDPELFEAEQRAVFQHEWQYVCHQTELPKSGDYLVDEIGGESLYVIRGRDDQIRAFYNVCQHRGHELLTGRGNVKMVVTCPYHAWCYDLEGKLRNAPMCDEVKGFDRTDVRLTPINVEIIGGFVFVNLDPDATPLREMAPAFESIVMAMVAEAPDLRYATHKDYDIKANWKIVTENFLEAYHVGRCGKAHVALGHIIDTSTYGFNINGRTIEYTARGGKAEVIPYDVNETDAFTNTRGAPFHQVFLWPNMTFSVFPGTNMLFIFNMKPAGPDRVAERITYFTLDGTMSEPTETAEAYISNQLNTEDVDLVEAVQRGVSSRGYKPGRLMVDPEQKEGWGEHFIHHFNTLNLEALNRAGEAG